jgi:dTDP-4-dehydrorhamnose reductase
MIKSNGFHEAEFSNPLATDGFAPEDRSGHQRALVRPTLELWGGIECSVNRVQSGYHDQMERSGHRERLSDLRLVQELGIKALRYPLLWEHHSDETVNWTWADERLGFLQSAMIEPIVGLVHHGSGPPQTHLLDSSFVTGLAAHARRVAERYPWLRYFNPVNEPLTTARFSGLYGHWYPHHQSERSFVRALLIQCEAIRAAMRAIRAVNPGAQLVQTEDLGRTYSTPLLAYQAAFDNERRWLSFVLLCGSVRPNHPLWGYLVENGATEAELFSFLEAPCVPDVVGINYYVNGERFLDERLDRYPSRHHGGNRQHAYADVAAVRVSTLGTSGPYSVLREAWDRYRLPIALTESHLGCTREEQLRWLVETWLAGERLLAEGGDMRAVTAWSLFGAYEWNSLLTRREDYYEPGAFDVRSPEPRRTAIGNCLRQLASTGKAFHPVLATQGWWRRPERLLYPPVHPFGCGQNELAQRRVFWPFAGPGKPLLITGAMGTLGRAFQRICELRGLPCCLLTRQELDIANLGMVRQVLAEVKPWAVINTAGYVRVDQAEMDSEACFRENTTGPRNLAQVCERHNIHLVTFSSDLVFDGSRPDAYTEDNPPAPLNVYGISKAEAERAVLKIMPSALIIRTSAFFGPWDEHNFATAVRRRLRTGDMVKAPADAIISPTYVPDLVGTCLDLLIDQESGIWHFANAGSVSWADFARRIAAADGFPLDQVAGVPLDQFQFSAKRPKQSALTSGRGRIMPTLDNAVQRYFSECMQFRSEQIQS